jgi:hypothetical protein
MVVVAVMVRRTGHRAGAIAQADVRGKGASAARATLLPDRSPRRRIDFGKS